MKKKIIIIKEKIYICNIFIFRQVLEDLELISSFKPILHVPKLSTPEQLLTVLEEVELFSKQELSTLQGKLHGKRYNFWKKKKVIKKKYLCLLVLWFLNFFFFFYFSIFIAIKDLLGLIDMTRQVEPNYRVVKFLTKLEEEGGME